MKDVRWSEKGHPQPRR